MNKALKISRRIAPALFIVNCSLFIQKKPRGKGEGRFAEAATAGRKAGPGGRRRARRSTGTPCRPFQCPALPRRRRRTAALLRWPYHFCRAAARDQPAAGAAMPFLSHEARTLEVEAFAPGFWSGSRTHGLRVVNSLLYQLSYPWLTRRDSNPHGRP